MGARSVFSESLRLRSLLRSSSLQSCDRAHLRALFSAIVAFFTAAAAASGGKKSVPTISQLLVSPPLMSGELLGDRGFTL